MSTVLVTDYAWPDLEIERAVIERAGLKLVSGPAIPASAAAIADLVQKSQPASILTCWAQVDASAVAASHALLHVGRIGVGLDNIDVAACTARGIPVTNVPDYCVEEVSDHALALALAWARGIARFDRAVRSGDWDPAKAKLRRVRELTAGIIGYGRIGRATAAKFAALGCRVLVTSRQPIADSPGIEIVDQKSLLRACDIVVLHVPLLADTHHLINAVSLAQMKPGGLLINVGRGGLVDTGAVISALQSGRLSGAGLDVLETEPEVPEGLIHQDGAILTPHVAFSSGSSLTELRRRAAEEAVRAILGQPLLNICK